ncbi:WxL domain-containing protein [Apilactobacillus ozensis]|uniref:WxL domain-containing protein n=1 Tax=Apilactobacillus ozensis TaxID=866801 RepID=UPI00200B8732|nr:WxL domain-containing protein [Apilactobacillus ozensis]MCK8607128.1 hypothetical protein [Apilactobacillus ozensis]
MSLKNKLGIFSSLVSIATLSILSLSGISASADSTSPSTPTQAPSKNAIGQIDNKGNATANSDMTNANANGNSVSGRSDAHINVINGYLVLETVPSLGFEDVSGQSGNNKSEKVIDHNTVLNSDSFFKSSEKPTDLYVLDARTGLTNGDYGYTVNASLGNFGTYQNGSTDTPSAVTNGDKFKLNLSGILDQEPSDNSSVVTNNVGLTSNNSSATVLTNNSRNRASGATKVRFDDTSKNGGGKTSLEVPQDMPAGQYAAPITWTLTPNVDGNSSGANGGTNS